MNKNRKVIKKIGDWYVDLSERPGTVLFRKFIQALNISPDGSVSLSLGQTVDAFVFGSYDHIAQKRIKDSMDRLNIKINKIEIDNELFAKNIEDFSKLVYGVYNAVGAQQYEELRISYINQLVHFIDVQYSKKQNKIYYQQLLFRLTIDHLHILIFAETYLTKDKGIRYKRSEELSGKIMTKFADKGMDKPLIMGLIKDLDSIGLFNEWTDQTFGGGMSHLTVTELGSKLIDTIQD